MDRILCTNIKCPMSALGVCVYMLVTGEERIHFDENGTCQEFRYDSRIAELMKGRST